MTTLADIQDAIIDTLKAMTTDNGESVFIDVEPWVSGDARDVENAKGIRAPSAFVVFLRADELDTAQEVTRWGVFTITGGVRDKAERNRHAMQTAENVAQTLRNNRLGLKKITSVKALSIDNLHSESLDRNGMGLFGISFEIKRHQ
jgi:hypothetical protein